MCIRVSTILFHTSGWQTCTCLLNREDGMNISEFSKYSEIQSIIGWDGLELRMIKEERFLCTNERLILNCSCWCEYVISIFWASLWWLVQILCILWCFEIIVVYCSHSNWQMSEYHEAVLLNGDHGMTSGNPYHAEALFWAGKYDFGIQKEFFMQKMAKLAIF